MSARPTATARRVVDLDHAVAAGRDNPVRFMRDRQAAAERRYCTTGTRADLALVLAYAESLDGVEYR